MRNLLLIGLIIFSFSACHNAEDEKRKDAALEHELWKIQKSTDSAVHVIRMRHLDFLTEMRIAYTKIGYSKKEVDRKIDSLVLEKYGEEEYKWYKGIEDSLESK